MIYGYARVSTIGQSNNGNSLEQQVNELIKYGCNEVVQEAYSGRTMDRPAFTNMINVLQPGDTLVICKLDRFARTTIEGVNVIQELFDRGVKVHILNMGMIEDTSIGRLILTVLLAFAEFERNQISERTQLGKSIARQNPNFKDGRPLKYSKEQIALALKLLDEGNTFKQVEKCTGISKSTLCRARNRIRASVAC